MEALDSECRIEALDNECGMEALDSECRIEALDSECGMEALDKLVWNRQQTHRSVVNVTCNSVML